MNAMRFRTRVVSTYRLVGARYYRQSAAVCLVVTTVYHVCVVGIKVRVPCIMYGW